VVSPHAALAPEGAPPRLGAARRLVVSPHAALPPEGAPPRLGAARRRVVLAAAPIDGDSDFVRFKTTRRGHYEALACKDDDVFDTLLWNERGELTEFTRGNVAVRLDGRWLTPPLSCGLLDGVGRARALRAGRLAEAVIRCEDLRRAQGLAFINSLRGWLEVELVPAADGSGLARG
ncbi:MAG: aminotransferase class IV, partial [Betaproteobacteria bacterium]|nr:aminotransferase class IV [Betaproteobacteria bacterium]